jgi:hypothetical protein
MNPITRVHLSRRSVLRGLGAAVALPWLDAMRPAFARAAPRAVRLAFVYIPNGVTLADWTPKATGRDYQMSRILKSLEPYRDDVLVLSGLAQRNGNALGDGPGDHARAGEAGHVGWLAIQVVPRQAIRPGDGTQHVPARQRKSCTQITR